MSKQDARKITIIDETLTGRFSNLQAAALLHLSVRQVQRLKRKDRLTGSLSLLHQNRGHRPSNSLDPLTRSLIVQIYRQELAGYNFSHACDVLAEQKNLFVSRSTVSRVLRSEGLRSPKAKRRPKRHRSRDAREHEGDMAQMDASSFDWLSDGSYSHLHGAIDDATGRILALHLEKEETFEGYCELTFSMNDSSHLPREMYVDRRGVFSINKKDLHQLTLEEELAGKTQATTQFARAMKSLNILLILAGSSQAKGRIERLWLTLQDRLPKDLKRLGISSVDDANAFFRKYIPYYNRKFAIQPLSPEPFYLPHVPLPELELVLAHHDLRRLDHGLSFSFNCLKYVIPRFCADKKVPASPHDLVTVVTSKRVGMQVLLNGLVLTPLKAKTKPATSIPVPPSTSSDYDKHLAASKLGRDNSRHSPWRQFTPNFFNPSTARGDISPAQLSTPKGDIFPDH